MAQVTSLYLPVRLDQRLYCKVMFLTSQTRLSQDTEHLLGAPHGLLYSEVTAGNLVKVDMGGQTLDAGFTGLSVNDAAFSVHAAVHASRPDIKCAIQLRNSSAVAVSECAHAQ